MQIPSTKIPVEPLSALEVLAGVTALAGRHFDRAPDLLTTDRLGRFEMAWYRDAEEAVWVPTVLKPTGLKQRQYLRLRLEMLVRQYAEHPGADYTLLTLNPEFPKAVELLLPTPPATD